MISDKISFWLDAKQKISSSSPSVKRNYERKYCEVKVSQVLEESKVNKI